MSSTAQRRRETRREELEKLKSSPCACCGGSFPPSHMCWDQVRDLDKPGFRISQHANFTWTAVLEQIERCDLVCRECLTHRRRFRIMLHNGRTTISPKSQSIHELRALKQEMDRWIRRI